jgi:predicted HicB family RNase H-like nuclease
MSLLAAALAAKMESQQSAHGPKPYLAGSVITVRVLPGFHQRLKEAAWHKHVSMNALCVAALEAALAEIEPQIAEEAAARQ